MDIHSMDSNLKEFVTKHETAKKEKQANSEISLIDLTEMIKKAFKEEDNKTGFFYLNLAMLSPSLDASSKMALLSMSSLAYFRTKNDVSLNRIVRKIFKYTKRQNVNKSPPEIMSIFSRILQKTAHINEDKGNLLYSCWFLYLAKNIFDTYDIKNDDTTYDVIKNSFPQVMGKISDYVNMKIRIFIFFNFFFS
jgi:hypothetical protein